MTICKLAPFWRHREEGPSDVRELRLKLGLARRRVAHRAALRAAMGKARGGLARWSNRSCASLNRSSPGYFETAAPPRFAAFGADLESPGVLAAAARQIAWRGEVILACGDGTDYASPTALNVVLQFYALKLHHVLYVSDSAASCAALRRALSIAGAIPGIAESNPGLQKMIFALLFPIALLNIVVTGTQLFTGNTASVAAAVYEGLAEPGALIGFAGQRVIQETIREQLPEGFQRAEYLLEHGMLDRVTDRRELREELIVILRMLMQLPPATVTALAQVMV